MLKLRASALRLCVRTNIIIPDRQLLFLKDRGLLTVVKPSATAYEPIAEYRVSDSPTVAHPVFLGDRILIKDVSTLKSFRIEQDAAKP
jgi:hypothetical protein